MARPSAHLFRRSQQLVVTLRGSRIIATNARERTSLDIPPELLRVLALLDDWTRVEGLAHRLKTVHERDLRRLLRVLERARLAERRTSRTSRQPEANQTWSEWGEAAAFFHFWTRRERYSEAGEGGENRLRTKALSVPPPSPVLRRKGAQVRLERPAHTAPVARALLKRRTWRTFGRSPLPLRLLSELLWLTFGVQHWGDTRGQGRVALKTSPSGGACHPIEAFVLARWVDGLVPGFYHYESDRHRLTCVKSGADADTMRACVQAQPWLGLASILVFLCPVFGRTAWRYPTPRAYRSVLIEAGHLGQTFCVLAAERGLAPFCTLATNDPHVDRQLGLDGVEQGVVYVVGCGTAPRAGFVGGVPFARTSHD